MIVKQYFTFRYFWLNDHEILNPKYDINHNIVGINSLNYSYICGNPEKDGRHLALIEFDDAEMTSTGLQINVIEEVMQKYSYHAKTPETALEFAKYITERNDLYLEDDIIIFPPIEH
jgi:hypothetical protein